MNLLMVAFPIQIGIGLFMLAVTLPLIASAFAGWPASYESLAEGVVEALIPEGGV